MANVRKMLLLVVSSVNHKLPVLVPKLSPMRVYKLSDPWASEIKENLSIPKPFVLN